MGGVQTYVIVANVASAIQVFDLWESVRAWERGARDEPSAIAAWTSLATLPASF